MAADDAHVSGSTLAPQIFLPNDLDHGITAIDHLGPLCRLEAWLRSGPAASPRLCRWALGRCCLVPNQHTLTTATSEARSARPGAVGIGYRDCVRRAATSIEVGGATSVVVPKIQPNVRRFRKRFFTTLPAWPGTLVGGALVPCQASASCAERSSDLTAAESAAYPKTPQPGSPPAENSSGA